MQLYYSNNIKNRNIILDEIESRHCTKVLRKKNGDNIFITNGKGELFEAKIIEMQKRNITAVIEKKTTTSENIDKYCHIAIAPTKNIDRFEWFLEKSTEIGIGRITPIICENSERQNIRFDRLEKILISAMKQSLKTFKPILDECTSIDNFFGNHEDFKSRYIAHCQNDTPVHLFEKYNKGDESIILIGPEGDFSSKEVEKSINNGFIEVSLGNSRLRTETAGIVACQTISLCNL